MEQHTVALDFIFLLDIYWLLSIYLCNLHAPTVNLLWNILEVILLSS